MRTVDIKEQEIFLEAIEIESAISRQEFVFHACGQNEILRQRVLGLIELQDKSGFILDRTLGLDGNGEITSGQREVADLTGTAIDKYHLIRLLGTGGMGDVYLAEQREPIRRRVAVKVIKLGLDTKNFVIRFSAERQALALMDHHGITKVFDAGSTTTGRPYLVMELVAGEPITQCCDENLFSIEKRLDVFLLLCKAIQHAHQKGVIHRDLKPSNILVGLKDGDFTPKVIDFGIAKANEHRIQGQTDLTQHACMIGTPEYMSPEQTDTHGNDQDIRTDLYSLGAILYELLTGTTPFELEGFKELSLLSVREIIQTRRIESPSSRVKRLVDLKPQVFRDRKMKPGQLLAALSGNLDAIVMKCLSKDRSERYASVADLARDLSRHMNGDSVEIVPESWFSNSIRIFQRHKRAIALISLGILLLVTTTVFSLISSVRANRYAEKAIEAELLSKQRLREANKARQVTQLERSRSSSLQRQSLRKQQELARQRIILSAIARYNKGDDKIPDDLDFKSSSDDRIVSSWLLDRLGPQYERVLGARKLAANSDTVKDDFERLRSRADLINDADRNDISLLELILEEHRRHISQSVTGKLNLGLAATLDLLGEKYLVLEYFEKSTELLRESLFIRAKNDPDSEARVWTMILLSKSLRDSGSLLESQTYLQSAKKLADRLPKRTRMRELISMVEE